MAKVLVLGDDNSAFLAVARSLGRAGYQVHAANGRSDAPARHSRYVAGWHEIPEYRGDGSNWCEALTLLHEQHTYAMIVPTSDSSLANLAGHSDAFQGAVCAIPNSRALEVFSSKQASRALAQELDVPVPYGRSLGHEENASALAEEIGLPAILKNRFSYRNGDSDQKSAVRLVRKPGDLDRILKRHSPDLIESYLPGFCRGVSVLAKDGHVLHAFQHRRLRQKHETGPSSHRISEPCDLQLLDWTRKMVEATGLTGVAMFEYRHCTEDAQYYLLEVNPRFWGSLPLAVEAGADYPAWLYAMLVEGRDPPVDVAFRSGLEKRTFLGERYNLGLAWNEVGTSRDLTKLGIRLAEFFALMLRGHAFDSWAADDPAPFHSQRRTFIGDIRMFFAKRLKRKSAGATDPSITP